MAAEFPPGSIFQVRALDAYAAFPLTDSAGQDGEIETRAACKDGQPFELDLRFLPVPLGGEPRCIRTVRNAGYMCVPDA